MKKLSTLALLLAVALITALAAAPVYGGGGDGQRQGPASHIVGFEEGVDPAQAAKDLAQEHGLATEFVYRHALRGASFIIPPPKVKDVEEDARVAFVAQNQRVHIFDQAVPTGVRRIFADDNPNIGIDGNDDLRIDVDVAVIDTGIYNHSDLNVVARTACSGGSPFKASCEHNSGDDGNGHGTHVAGTIGAIDNDVGVVGVAPGARLWAVKVLRDDGSGYLSWITAGIDYVTANADQIEVANMSLGCECSSQAMDDAISNSVAAGVVYAVAAGNNDKDAYTFSPANHPDVITVSALADFDGGPGKSGSSTCRSDEDDTLANFSNWGSLIEITAPGVCILSTWKDGGYNTISGTSMASPHVAGAAALLASGIKDPQNEADVDAIIDTIINAGNLDWTDDSGDGVQEPLLDVSDAAVFYPASVAGSSGGGSSNNPPTADAVDMGTVQEDSSNNPWTPSVSDPDPGDTLSCTIAAQPDNGAATIASDCSSGAYTPDPNYYGSDAFTYSVSDGNGGSDTGAVSINVSAVNDAPAANNVSDTTTEDTSDTWFPDVNDVDGDTLNCTADATSMNGGAVTVNSDCSSGTYSPPAGFTGTDNFEYAACDAGGLCDSGIVTYSVAEPTTGTMHVGDLDGSTAGASGPTWEASVTVTVHEGDENGVQGTTVAVKWGGTKGYSGGSAQCTTDAIGECQVSTGDEVPKNNESVTLNVDSVSHATLTYDPSLNHDPDGDSDGTSITISKP